MFMYILLLITVVAGVLYYLRETGKAAKKEAAETEKTKEAAPPNDAVGQNDIIYLAQKLHPGSTQLDVLMAVASTPGNIAYGLNSYNKKEETRRERIKSDLEDAKKAKSKTSSTDSSTEMFNLDDEGWADDDADDETAKAAAKADADKQKEREQLQKAVGSAKVKLEGIDPDVVGQKWVENLMASKGLWPPKSLGILDGETFDYEGKQVSALDHPGLRRNICMIFGRLHSMLLNSHPELLEKGPKQLLDQTYFKASMEFRGRCALLLEGSLRTAIACRNYPLAKTIVEAVGIFKIGTPSSSQVGWFNTVMMKQYNTLPRLKLENIFVECTGEPDMAATDTLALGLEVTREHAEHFTRQKIAMFQKQGIPPQVALQSYREGWWFFLRAERLDGETPGSVAPIKAEGILKDVPSEEIAKFEQAPFQDRLLTAWPMMVQNVAQKSGKVKIKFPAPSVPGKYKFVVSVKSQDFLGADQELSVEGVILDSSKVIRTKAEEETTGSATVADEKSKKEN